jgi:hypothetical protein
MEAKHSIVTNEAIQSTMINYESHSVVHLPGIISEARSKGCHNLSAIYLNTVI